MTTFTRFEEIKAWQSARDLTKNVYAISNEGKIAKDFALKDQMRKASVSIMANIAEGFDRDGNGEFIQFLSIAKASSAELRSHLYVALDASYLSMENFEKLFNTAQETSRMIKGLMTYLMVSELKGIKKARNQTNKESNQLDQNKPSAN